MSCFDGHMVPSSQCIHHQCDFNGIQCANGFYTPTSSSTCSSYFMTCINGQLSTPIPTGFGTFCLNGSPAYARDCISYDDSKKCTFVGVKCANENGQIWENTEMLHYVLCVNGVVSDPIPVPDGSICLNNHFITNGLVHCDGEMMKCSGRAVQCVNSYGSLVHNACTAYYRTCTDGQTTAPLTAPEGYTCYNGAFIPQTLCQSVDTSSCSFCRNRCIDNDGVADYTGCTHRYVTCVNGSVSSPQEVPTGTACLKGNIIPAGFCPLSPYCVGCPAGEQGAQGAQGPQGAMGITGEQGPEGPMGPEGPTGVPGEEGEPGPTGAAGVTGPEGPMGPMGARGSQGAAGEEGAMGATGEEGAMGEEGEQGPQGASGQAGDRGATGATGGEGPAGPAGITGVTGATGATGATGVVGATGLQGGVGAAGAVGATGAAGAAGATGARGAVGATGGEGVRGPSGAPGAVGEIENLTFFQTIEGATRFLLNSRVDNVEDTSTTSTLVVYKKTSGLFDGINVELTFDRE